ncbi:TDP-N-acetylfucosamine:lipid II N-acetylfucosaminyltransferase [Cyclobacterium plantarum]|uniref:TDP-N-acetylfucosamine:lipid II N-acetylfucosaminyltransferase n=1 Tax=Cyclobacterium plantarum TaxID=2716263 RepID=A0ABX0H5V3_9BACT|nr:TDP-N-acetylfucosamine:lipid II N-acetylfucosaminyltransferase [Cyclobacterium plantarum]NHE56243.1 TDP-N-acetylfucosamine:lipid II N-acetylfucosaminyltransferase [Cyclobacterium plantarum]
MKIIHIIRDEKFFDSAYRVFEELLPAMNHFIILGKKHKLYYIKNAKVKFIRPTIFILFRNIFLYKYDSVIIHGLHSEAVKLLVTKLNPNLKVFWIGWGFDYFRFWNSNDYKPITLKTIGYPGKGPKLRKINFFLNGCKPYVSDELFLKKVDFFSPVLDIEFDLFKKFHPKTTFQFIDWNYLTLEDDIIKGFEGRVINGNNLLFGNSAHPLNNHLDGVKEILRFNFMINKIICPLSYGNKINKNETIKICSNTFGNKFIALTDFMDYESYVGFLLSCKYVFINSIRQVAMGNILLMLYLGSYVILDPINPVYEFFLKRGIKVYSIHEAVNGNFENIDIESVRTKLLNIWGREAILKKTKFLLNSVKN